MTTNKPVAKLGQPDDNYKFQPLPQPAGIYPFHLAHVAKSEHKMVLHMVGDTGGFRDTNFQHKVAAAMAAQYDPGNDLDNQPEFLYHLGDLVYNYGEAASYSEQFFQPYEAYPGHIYAIAGNHDSDVDPAAAEAYQSLDAFSAVFCDTGSRKISFGGDTRRKSGMQPNVYWTLETPLASIIGLYSNVTKYGIITAEQRNWLIEELQMAAQQQPHKAIIVALHHAPYSADTNHGSSLPMIELLEGVFKETGVRPNLVVSGHVHNYQRFTKNYNDGQTLTYLVAGAGGYDELHTLTTIGDERFSSDDHFFDNVQLQAYNYKRHGFLKLTLQKEGDGVNLSGEYYLVDNQPDMPAQVTDRFTISTIRS